MQIIVNKMNRKYLKVKQLILILSLNLSLFIPYAKSAENLSLVHGIFNRTISIDLIEDLAKTGEAKGSLKNLLHLSNQSPKTIAELLNEEYDLKLVTISKLMYSSIGQVILLRIAKIIHPIKIKDQAITIPALRSGVISGVLKGNGKLNLIQFLKSYPNKTIAINIPALNKVLNKVESMTELIKFFSGAPLEDMKKGKATD